MASTEFQDRVFSPCQRLKLSHPIQLLNIFHFNFQLASLVQLYVGVFPPHLIYSEYRCFSIFHFNVSN